jgi:hypothetical protein
VLALNGKVLKALIVAVTRHSSRTVWHAALDGQSNYRSEASFSCDRSGPMRSVAPDQSVHEAIFAARVHFPVANISPLQQHSATNRNQRFFFGDQAHG